MKKLFLFVLFFSSLLATAQQQKLFDAIDGRITNRLFFDQEWRYRWMSNSLISGGIVSWVSGFTFAVTSAKFTIAGREYSSAGGQITLDAAHPTLPRFDVIALNTSGQIVKITGTALAIPAVPQVTPATQVYLTAILVGGGASSPGGITSLLIYDEDVEWGHSHGGFTTGISFSSATQPYSLTKSINVSGTGLPTDAGASGGFKFANGANSYAYSDYTLVRFYIRLKAALPAGAAMQVSLGVGNEQLTTIGQAHGFNPALANVYQNITIPISEFNKLGTSFEALYFNVSRSSVGFYIDKIELQGGITTGGNGAYDTIAVDPPLRIYRNTGTGQYRISVDTVSLIKDGILTAAQYASLGGGSGVTVAGNNFNFQYKNGGNLGTAALDSIIWQPGIGFTVKGRVQATTLNATSTITGGADINATGRLTSLSGLALGNPLPSTGTIIDVKAAGNFTEKFENTNDSATGRIQRIFLFQNDLKWREGVNVWGTPSGGFGDSYNYGIEELRGGQHFPALAIEYRTRFVGFNTHLPTAAVDIEGNKIRLRQAKTPSSATDTGNTGDICWDALYVYICIATNTWKRSAITTW